MKNLFRNIALSSVLMAMILLMGERIVPHHHCGEGASVAGAVHFGYGECSECEHMHHGHSHTHTEEHCCDDSEYYSRQSSNETEFGKKFLPQPLVCLAVVLLLPIQQPQRASLYSDSYILKIPDRGVCCPSLRAPPVA